MQAMLLMESPPLSASSALRVIVLVAFLALLLLVLVIGAALLMRWGRRLTRGTHTGPVQPTACSDVWSLNPVSGASPARADDVRQSDRQGESRCRGESRPGFPEDEHRGEAGPDSGDEAGGSDDAAGGDDGD